MGTCLGIFLTPNPKRVRGNYFILAKAFGRADDTEVEKQAYLQLGAPVFLITSAYRHSTCSSLAETFGAIRVRRVSAWRES